MSLRNAQPQVSVRVFPSEGEGAPYVLSSSQGVLLRASIRKSIRGSEPGTFQLVLAPGGARGVASTHTWTEIFTPMSIVVISGARGPFRAGIMVGVVSSVRERQQWSRSTVTRVITVTGYDFQYFFTHRSYYTLTFLGSSAASALHADFGSFALPSLLNKGMMGGTPAQVGATWFNEAMAGKEGILADTKFLYDYGRNPTFTDLMTQTYDNYPSANVIIPMMENFLTVEGAWYDKFTRIFAFPFYEFFVITAPVGLYDVNNTSYTTAKTLFNSPESVLSNGSHLPFGPVLVARVNPLPQTVYTNGVWSMDTTRWKNLPSYTLGTDGESYGFLDSDIQFTDRDVRNFYLLNPITLSSITVSSAGNVSPYVYTLQCMADIASIRRYGYRPEITDTYWLADPTGATAAGNNANQNAFADLVNLLNNRISSYYEPTPLMGMGAMRSIFRPDIIPGNRFVYAPFKNGELWEFYIEGVEHEYEFGEESTTTLALTRGLPKTLYDQTTPGLLTALHTGTAERTMGEYKVRTSMSSQSIVTSPGLTVINPGDSHSVLGEIAQIFVTPQKG